MNKVSCHLLGLGDMFLIHLGFSSLDRSFSFSAEFSSINEQDLNVSFAFSVQETGIAICPTNPDQCREIS